MPFAQTVRAVLNAASVPLGAIVAWDVKPVQFGKTVPTGIEPFSTVMFRYGSSGDAGVVV